jgi:hypothetical protein
MRGTSLDVFTSSFLIEDIFGGNFIMTFWQHWTHKDHIVTFQNNNTKRQKQKKTHFLISDFCNVITDNEDFWNCGSET